MRYRSLDSWRGLCALLVVLYHAQGKGFLGDSAFVHGAFLFVDFFFVLSGFVMCEAALTRIDSGSSLRQFLLRRLARVWPLHAFMLLAFLALETLKLLVVQLTGAPPTREPFSGIFVLSGFLPSLFLLHSMGLLSGLTWNGPSWSIAAEYWTYVVFGLVVLGARRRFVVVAGLLAATAAGTLVWRSTRGMDATFDLGFVRCLYGFFVGALVHRLSQRWRLAHAPFGTGVELAVTLGALAFVAVAFDTSLAFLSPLVFAFVIFVFAWSNGGLAKVLQTRGFTQLGLWSYSIYMTHLFLLGLASGVASALNRAIDSPAWTGFWETPAISDITVLGFAGAVVLVSSVTYRLIEVPGQALLQRWAPTPA